MTMQEIWNTVVEQFAELAGGYVPNLVGALIILLVGWLVALAAGGMARKGMRRIALSTRASRWIPGEPAIATQVQTWVGRGVFWTVFLFALIAFTATLQLTVVTQPLNELLTTVFSFIPQIIAAAALLFVAWLAATVLKVLVLGASDRLRLDERLGRITREGQPPSLLPIVPTGKILADVTYWLMLLIFLPAVLAALSLEGLLLPVQGMVERVLVFLPNVFAAAVILVLGWLAGRLVQRVVTNLLISVGADRMAEQSGVANLLGQRHLSGLAGMVVYLLIMIPVLLAALNALSLEAVTGPASSMLGLILTALPRIFAAALLVAIVYVVARIVSQLIGNVLAGIGFNGILVRLGVGQAPEPGQRTPSNVVEHLVLVGAMILASIEASRLLGFDVLANLVAGFLLLSSKVLFGVVLVAFGLFLSNLAATSINATRVPQAHLLAFAARVGLLVLAGAIALRSVDVANEIIVLAFGIPLAAIGVAMAIAFGMGARETAGREVEAWVSRLRGGKP